MKYLVYKITNNINGRIYIGVHQTEDVNDNYMGSGLIIKRAVSKYGKDNFSKEILCVFDNSAEMFRMESVLVDESFVEREDTYNLVLGGENSLSYVNDNMEKFKPAEQRKIWAKLGRKAANAKGANINGSKKHHDRLKNDPDYRVWFIEQCMAAREGLPGTFTGNKHTDEAKRKIGEANSKLFKGENNPNYGKCWIYSITEKRSISIPKDQLTDYISSGWIKGRKLKF